MYGCIRGKLQYLSWLRWTHRRRECHNGHSPSCLLALSPVGVEVLLVAGGADGGYLNVLCGHASSMELERVGGEQVHGPAFRSMGDEELFPGGKMGLKRSDSIRVE